MTSQSRNIKKVDKFLNRFYKNKHSVSCYKITMNFIQYVYNSTNRLRSWIDETEGSICEITAPATSTCLLFVKDQKKQKQSYNTPADLTCKYNTS